MNTGVRGAGQPLPEALAYFSVGEIRVVNPLRPLTWIAAGADVLAISLSVLIGFVTRGTGDHSWFGALAILSPWVAALAVSGSYDSGRIGLGSEEFRNVLKATACTFAVFATLVFIAESTDGRRFVVATFLAGAALLLVGRRGTRLWLFHRRKKGLFMRRTLVIGSGPSRRELESRLTSDPRAGFQVVKAMEGPLMPSDIDAWLDRVSRALRDYQVDAVAISPTRDMSSEVTRRLSWRLEGPSIDLLVAPALGEVLGPRVKIRPASGLPLLHLDEPRLAGPQSVLKRAIDMLVASMGLLILSPLLLVIGAVIRLTFAGPWLYIEDRVGQAGQTFQMVRVRTRCDSVGQSAVNTGGSGAGSSAPLRVARIQLGRFLRRWSLDALPQLWNVLVGDMSLVGPRPIVLEELPLLDAGDHRRHLTKPGLTGLWQVSGRKEVGWGDRMQLDLHYVENWSPTLDLIIMLKSVKAVASGKGGG